MGVGGSFLYVQKRDRRRASRQTTEGEQERYECVGGVCVGVYSRGMKRSIQCATTVVPSLFRADSLDK